MPGDASNLTLALYCVRANFKVRQLSVSELGPASPATTRKVPGFVNVFNIPGRPVLPQPTNLSFEASNVEPQARVAHSQGDVEINK